MQLYRQPEGGGPREEDRVQESTVYCILYPRLGGPIWSCIGSQKGVEESTVCILYLRLEGPLWSCTSSQEGERVEERICLIPEAGGAYMELYRQP
jgi:hypothetical protein